MAASINGIGTRFYGASDYRTDGSVITTKWFALIFIPIFPLSSYRLIRQTKGDKFLIFGYSASYEILEKLPIQWAQVFRTYVFAFLCAAWLVAAGLGLGKTIENWKLPAWIHWIYLIIVFPIPFYVLGFIRSRHKKRIYLQHHKAEADAANQKLGD